MAGYSPDLSRDLEVVDGLDTFTLKVEGSSDVTLDECVLTEPVDTSEPEPVAGQVNQMDQLMVWPKYRSTAKPPIGSCLVDADGIYWTILACRLKQHVECWEAHCRNLSIVDSLDNVATILRAAYGKGRSNEARAEWLGCFSGKRKPTDDDIVAARFQPSPEDAAIRFGAEWARETYRVLLAKSIPLQLARGEFRLQDKNGGRYRITHYYGSQRLASLPVCIAIRVTEGSEFFGAGAPDPLPAPTFPNS